MLKKEDLITAGLSEENATKVASLSETDHNTTVKDRDKTIYGLMQTKVKDDTGIDFKQDELTTDYAVRAFNEKYKADMEGLNTKIGEHEGTITTLNDTIKNSSGDEELKKQSEEWERKFTNLDKVHSDSKTEHEKALLEKDGKMSGLIFGNAFQKALPGFDKDANKYEIEARTKEAEDHLKAFKHSKYENGHLYVSDNEVDYKKATDVLANFKGFESVLPKDNSRGGGGSGSGNKSGDTKEGVFQFPEGITMDAKDWGKRSALVKTHMRENLGLKDIISDKYKETYTKLMGEEKKEEKKD